MRGGSVYVRDRERAFSAGEDVAAQTFLRAACGLQTDRTLSAVGQDGPEKYSYFLT